jgi:hypothetical protein
MVKNLLPQAQRVSSPWRYGAGLRCRSLLRPLTGLERPLGGGASGVLCEEAAPIRIVSPYVGYYAQITRNSVGNNVRLGAPTRIK